LNEKRTKKKTFVRRVKITEQHKINEKITSREVRLVLRARNQKLCRLLMQLKLAEEQEMDLVEISPNAVPPVCKIMDYRKFLYNQKRKQKELKAKQSKVVIERNSFWSQHG
jgi:translation initiation factor IF-3